MNYFGQINIRLTQVNTRIYKMVKTNHRNFINLQQRIVKTQMMMVMLSSVVLKISFPCILISHFACRQCLTLKRNFLRLIGSFSQILDLTAKL